MLKQALFTSLFAASAALAGAASAAPIYSESFDYGGTTDDLENVSGWSTSSTFNDYVHDGGLDVATMNGETGGAWFADRPNGNLQANDSSVNLDMSTISAGGEVWAAVLFDYVAGTSHTLNFGGGSVSGLGFTIDASGNVLVLASDNGGANANHDTGEDAASGTHLLLIRATKGTGTSPTNSTVDFWFNPTDTSSAGALGAVDWTTGADSKFGRDSQSITTVGGTLSSGGSTDEIRLGTELVDVVGIPEPASLALLGLGGLCLLGGRRRSA